MDQPRFPCRATLSAIFILLSAASDTCAERLRLQLKWLHQFQFAGYYAALERGYYRDAGLDVEFIEGRPDLDPAKEVLAGHADYGVGTPELLLSRAAGKPLVVLAVIFQHSPYVFLVLRSRGIHDISDLVGKRVMIEPQAAELYAYLHREKVDARRLQILPHTFSPQSLVDGSVDAMSAYSADEPYFLHRAGLPYLTLSPQAAGVDFYGDCLFTTEGRIRQHPAQVKAFYNATLKGWEYAVRHPEELIEIILTRYRSAKSREALRFEAEKLIGLMHPDIVPVGYMYRGRWAHIAATYQELGMLQEAVDLDPFLYEPDPAPDFAMLYWIAGGSAAVALVTWAILLPIWRLNRRLRIEIAERIEAGKLLAVARDAAFRATQAKVEFLSHISHDLRTPVATILFQAETLAGRAGPAEREHAEIIRAAASQLGSLIDDLLDLSCIEHGRMELQAIPFRLEEVLLSPLTVLGDAARRKGLTLEEKTAGDIPTLIGDPGRLRQVLYNLVGNAVKYTDSGTIQVRTGMLENGWLRIEVNDTGPGIPETDREAIFDAFCRGSHSLTRASEGAGLGLAICRRVVEAMGGAIRVESVIGEGSSFIVELPAAKKDIHRSSK